LVINDLQLNYLSIFKQILY